MFSHHLMSVCVVIILKNIVAFLLIDKHLKGNKQPS